MFDICTRRHMLRFVHYSDNCVCNSDFCQLVHALVANTTVTHGYVNKHNCGNNCMLTNITVTNTVYKWRFFQHGGGINESKLAARGTDYTYANRLPWHYDISWAFINGHYLVISPVNLGHGWVITFTPNNGRDYIPMSKIRYTNIIQYIVCEGPW